MSESWIEERRPGVGRLDYFFGKVGLGVAMVFAASNLDPEGWPLKLIGMVLSYASFALEVGRLQRIGLSRWWAVLRFVPYVNLLYLIFLQSAPARWAASRRMDRAGKTLLVFQLALLVVIMVMLMKMRVAVPYFPF